MNERQFGRLIEDNDNEGESWTWWLQLDGNEDELTKFAKLLDAAEVGADEVGYEFSYHLVISEWEPESVVDKLVYYAEGGYYDSHNKVVGEFTCPASLGDYATDLYKGAIRDLFRVRAG